MTVSSTTDREQYVADGVDDTFIYSFYILNDAEIAVYLRDDAANTSVKQTLTTHYTVTNSGNPGGGNVVFVTPPVAPNKVVLTRDPALTQLSDYPIGGPFPSTTAETSWDRLTMITQYLQEEIGRCLRFQDGDEPVGVFIPTSDVRAGAILSFDENGDLTVDTQLGTNRGTWAPSTAYALRDIVYVDSGANQYNIYQTNEAHTSGATFAGDIAKWGLLLNGADIAAASIAASLAAVQPSVDAAAASAAAALVSETNAASSETQASASAVAADASAGNAVVSASEAMGYRDDTQALLDSVTAISLESLQGQINQINWLACASGAFDSAIEDWEALSGSEDWNVLSGSEDYGSATCS